MNTAQPLLKPEERQAPRALVERALMLVGRIHHGDARAAQAAQAELARWRAASPDHAEATATAQLIWNATSAVGLREQVPLPPSAEQLQRRRRRVTGLLGVGALALCSGLGARWYWRQPQYQLALNTGRAQTLARALPDGGAIDLAARTDLQVTYYRDRRTVQLTQGEARFDVAHDADRPFTVQTPWGHVRVLGTAFTVAARNGRMDVAVVQGRVAVWPGALAGASAPITLQAGQSIQADQQGLGQATSVDASDVAAWRQGWLVFRNTPLPEAVARWNDYLAQPLHLADAAGLQALRLTGSYPLRNPQAFIESLPVMLPVRVTRVAGGGAEIRPR
mgnify:CR=1 FL=1